MRRRLALLLFLALLAATPLSAKGDLPLLMRKLGLSADQVKKIEALQQKQQKAIAPVRRQLRDKFKELEALLEADEVSMQAVREKVAQIGKLRAELMLKRIETTLALRKILTKAQVEKLKALKKEHRRKGPAAEGGES